MTIVQALRSLECGDLERLAVGRWLATTADRRGPGHRCNWRCVQRAYVSVAVEITVLNATKKLGGAKSDGDRHLFC